MNSSIEEIEKRINSARWEIIKIRQTLKKLSSEDKIKFIREKKRLAIISMREGNFDIGVIEFLAAASVEIPVDELISVALRAIKN